MYHLYTISEENTRENVLIKEKINKYWLLVELLLNYLVQNKVIRLEKEW